MDHASGDRADREPSEASAPVRPHDDEIDVLGVDGRGDGHCDVALTEDHIHGPLQIAEWRDDMRDLRRPLGSRRVCHLNRLHL